MVYCAAFGCNSDSRYNTSVSYHCFPSDKALQDQWLARISRADLVVTKHSRLCSLHFTPDDYERDLRAELTGRKRKRDLKTGVIPSIFSHRPAKKPRTSSEKRLEEKARQEVGPNKLYNYECKQETCTYLSHNCNKPWHKGQIGYFYEKQNMLFPYWRHETWKINGKLVRTAERVGYWYSWNGGTHTSCAHLSLYGDILVYNSYLALFSFFNYPIYL